MRKRIYRISEDKFDDVKPNIEFSTTSIVDTCFIGEPYEGSFIVKSTNNINARGMVYCDCPYVSVKTPLFDSQISTISFSIPDLHMLADEKIAGKFTVILYGLEQEIPFEITYSKRPLLSSTGEIATLQDFADFAQSRFSEAVAIFYSKQFEDFMSTQDKDTRLLYRGFKGTSIMASNVDEFLVACGYKASMTFDVKERHDEYYAVTENIRSEIEIIRSSWGYIDIEVKSDNDFVSVEKEHITSDYFLGSVFNMNYYVHKEKMHAGKNYAKITLDFRGIHKEITIMATATPEGVVVEKPIHEQNTYKLKLFRLYEDYRLKRITSAVWSKETLEVLEKISFDYFEENQILLYKALVLITNQQRQEALWIIQDLKRTIENKRSTEWAFLLYLCTLIEREESYVDRITEDIEGIFKENNDDVQIFWFLLFLRKEYIKNPTLKLRDIAEWICSGHEVSALYIEAYYVFLQDPYLIASFDDFTLKVLLWAKRHNAITRDVAIQMIHVLETQKEFSEKALGILETSYEVYPDLHLLLSIVTFVLKAPEQKESYFKWYRLAVEANLHIPGLFEAYMQAVPIQSVERLPQLVTMFFRYNNDLPYERKALLYANIILHKQEDKTTYDQYERTIESFAIEQLKQGHLDDNLAICYQQLLEMGLLDNDLAKLLTSFIFRKKIAVIYPNIRRVILYQEEFKAPTIALVNDHQAYMLYMGSEGKIFLEDFDGHLISDENGYLVEDIMNPLGFMENLRKMAPSSFPFILHDLAFKTKTTDFVAEDISSIEQFLHTPQIANEYRAKMYPKFIEFLRFSNREDVLEKHFMHETKLYELPNEIITQVLDILLVRCKYDEAYNLLKETNCLYANIDTLTKLCRYMINKLDNQSDDFLILLAAKLITEGQVHKDILYYLSLYYVGPTSVMISIFKGAADYNLDVVEFSERILTQVMYRDMLCDEILEIFDAYMSRKTNRMIVEAFLTYEAHEYLSKNVQIPEEIFAYIFNRIKKAMDVNESMRIALLKYLCLQEELDEDDLDMLDMLMADAVFRNQYFGFYSKCNRKIQIKYHLYDKYFVEYQAGKHSLVTIDFSINGNEVCHEEMIEMYDGLFVKEFVLFFGDELKYSIYKDRDETAVLSDKHVVSDTSSDVIEGRYSIMNNISRLKIYQDKNELIAQMKKYQGLDEVTKDLFTTI